MHGKAYLRSTMLRRILACFALITGLAAAGSPAEARVVAVMSQSVVEAAQGQQQAPAVACEASQRRAALRGKVSVSAPCRQRKSVVIILPTIQLGSDRALE